MDRNGRILTRPQPTLGWPWALGFSDRDGPRLKSWSYLLYGPSLGWAPKAQLSPASDKTTNKKSARLGFASVTLPLISILILCPNKANRGVKDARGNQGE